jgi:hypothetical protein
VFRLLSALLGISLLASACKGGTTHDAAWASTQLKQLQTSLSSAVDRKDWSTVYDLYTEQNAEGGCTRDDFTRGMRDVDGSTLRPWGVPPTATTLVSADEAQIVWKVGAFQQVAKKVGPSWLYQSSYGPCGDFVG